MLAGFFGKRIHIYSHDEIMRRALFADYDNHDDAMHFPVCFVSAADVITNDREGNKVQENVSTERA